MWGIEGVCIVSKSRGPTLELIRAGVQRYAPLTEVAEHWFLAVNSGTIQLFLREIRTEDVEGC